MLSRYNAVRLAAARGPGRAGRAGLTLLEVLVALAIFFMAWVGIARLIGMASNQAIDARLQSEALQVAQSKLDEVISGVTPLQSQSESALDPSEAPGGQSNWTWALDANPADILNLYTVQIRVTCKRGDGTTTQVALTQLVLDPATRGSTLNPPTTSSSSSGSSGSSMSSQ
jgi:type II secretion system protein I